MKQKFSADYSVLTFATNKLVYLQFALNCARSILLFNDIKIFIVTNLDFTVPAKLKDNVFFLPALTGHAAMGIGMKLHIDQYLQTTHTLFIDSDCLCFDSLKGIFEAAKQTDVSAAGHVVPAADWCGNEQAKTIKENFGIEKLVRFNGGLYYLKKSAVTARVFTKTREIADKYDAYGFRRINNKWINEEGPLSIAMILNNQLPIADDGRFMTDLYTDPMPALNVLKGKRALKNKVNSARHRAWYPLSYSPVIIHFGGTSLNKYPYSAQLNLLRLANVGLPRTLATLIINTFFHFPYRKLHWLIGLLKKLKTSS